MYSSGVFEKSFLKTIDIQKIIPNFAKNKTSSTMIAMKDKLLIKSIILMSMVLLISSNEIMSQTYEFAPIGAEWYYTRYYRIGQDPLGIACDKFTSVRTVYVNGMECKEIRLYKHIDCNGEINPSIEYRYVYQDDKLIYEVENETMYLLYDFSKDSGDFWIAPKYNDTIYVRKVSLMTLDDGTTRKVLEVESSSFNWFFSDVIEGIGMTHSLFPHEYFDGSPCVHGPIRCYFEDNVQIISSQYECDYETLHTNQLYNKQSVFITNIVEDMLHVKFSDEINSIKIIHIFDAMGRLVYLSESTDNCFDISFNDKPAGIYVFHTYFESDHIDIKFLKK